MERKTLWRIYVPKASNEGVEYARTYHQQWDEKVRELAGGLTIHRTAIGQWVSPQDETFVEKMIPVEIACSEHEIYEIVRFTMQHYDQLAVSIAKISDDFRIIYREDLEGKLIK
jgi:hypothetical protein